MSAKRKSPPRGKDPARGMVECRMFEGCRWLSIRTGSGAFDFAEFNRGEGSLPAAIRAAIRFAVERDRKERP